MNKSLDKYLRSSQFAAYARELLGQLPERDRAKFLREGEKLINTRRKSRPARTRRDTN